MLQHQTDTREALLLGALEACQWLRRVVAQEPVWGELTKGGEMLLREPTGEETAQCAAALLRQAARVTPIPRPLPDRDAAELEKLRRVRIDEAAALDRLTPEQLAEVKHASEILWGRTR